MKMHTCRHSILTNEEGNGLVYKEEIPSDLKIRMPPRIFFGEVFPSKKKKTNILMKEIVSEFFHVEKIAGNYFSFKKESIPRIAKNKKIDFSRIILVCRIIFPSLIKKTGRTSPGLEEVCSHYKQEV